MSIQTSTLRPGLLVSLKSSVSGNVQYARRDIEQQHKTKDGKARAKWETVRVVTDPAEHEEAIKTRHAARWLITQVCAESAFGLLCPDNAEQDLEKAITEARKLTDAFNAKAKLTRLSLYVMTGRIAADDVEAVKAINSEVRDLLGAMEQGIKNLDVKAVRAAASKARNIGAMLSLDARAKIQTAIEAARASAKEIAKAGEQAALELDTRNIKMITEARTAFLDLDEIAPVAKTKATARAVDLTPTKSQPKRKASAARQLEVE